MTAAETARYVVAKAVWAPSVHNTQPWRFTVSGQQISLHADAGHFIRTQLSEGAYPHLVLRIGLVTQVAVSVRRDPDEVLFSTGPLTGISQHP